MIYQTKVDKLVIDNTKGDYQSYVYVAPGEQGGTTGLGQLFIIVEIRSREKKIPAVLNQIVEELSEYYYHSPTKNTEAALETTCQYFNENILDITGKNLKWVKDKMSILVAAIQENKLILSNYNNIKVWMMRDNKIHDITAGQSDDRKPAGKKILSQLISGQLMHDDVLLLTNSTIFDYFSDVKIKKTISILAPTQACAFFKNTLLDYKVPVDFSTIIVKFSSFKKEIPAMAREPKKNVLEADREIEELNKAEPGIAVKIARGVNEGLKSAASSIKDKVGGLIKSRIKLKKKSKLEKPGEVEVKEEEKLIRPEDQMLGKGESWMMKFKKWKSINVVEYRLVMLIVIIGILFGGSLLLVNNRKEKQQKHEDYQELVETINDKLNSMEAALIYKDEVKAQELLSEARELLTQLPQENANQQYKYQELNESIESQVNRIYKLDKIENPEVIAMLPEGFKPTSNIYIGPGNILYLARGGEVYKVNSENQSVDKVADVQGQIKKILSFEKSRVLLVTNQNEVWLMDTSNYSTRQVSLSGIESVKDMDTYSQKLYVLDEGKNEIYKYTYSTASFGSPAAWLSEDEDLVGNEGITVDGNVWLFARDGKISKFFKGKKEVFNLRGAYEPISDQTSLYTSDELNNIYLLDKEKNRGLIANKQGKVGKQLLGDGVDKIISIMPNANETELYIMTESRVYRIEL